MSQQERTERPVARGEPVVDHDIDALLALLRRERGLDFSGYKRASLTRRVQQRVSSLGLGSITEYVARIEQSADEPSRLIDALLINVTSFFRDRAVWEGLAARLATTIDVDASTPIRAWSAGCSSGEEPYTLAILLRELLGPDAFERRVKIYATDLDEDALSFARAAAYPAAAVDDLPEGIAADHFIRVGDQVTVAEDVRRAIVFGRHDLVRDAPIPQIDLLTCRNVLMYLEPPTQERVLEGFRFALRPTGLLLVGRAEMLLTHARLFAPIDLSLRLFSPGARPPSSSPPRPRSAPPPTLEPPVRPASTAREASQLRRLRSKLRRADLELASARTSLRRTRGELGGAREALHLANEELETTNEELQATSEELASLNEELESTNEELQTLNEELRRRGGDLAETGALLGAVLGALRCGVAVVDSGLRVRVWSPVMERVSGVYAHQALGRSLAELAAPADRTAVLGEVAALLRAAAHESIEHVRPIDGPGRDGENTPYEVRVVPLRGGRTNGGAIAVVDEVD